MPETLTAPPPQMERSPELDKPGGEPLFPAEESIELFGINGNMTDAFKIGEQTFAIFDISNADLVATSDGAVRYPFERNSNVNTGIRADREFLISQLDDEGRVTPDKIKGLRTGERVILGREHNADRFDYDPFASRKHVEVHLNDNNKPIIIDQQSTNGTKILDRESIISEFKLADTPETVEPAEVVSQDVQEMLDNEVLKPQSTIEIDGKAFYVSDVVRSPRHRDRAVLYSYDNGQIVARNLYKSHSDGGWRVTSGLDKGGNDRYIKGSERHYTQETKLHPTILKELEGRAPVDSEQAEELITRVFETTAQEAIEEFEHETQVVAIEDRKVAKAIAVITAGDMSTSNISSEELIKVIDKANKIFGKDSSSSQPKFMPDFNSGSLGSEKREHTLLGECTYTKFKATINGREAFWEFGDDGNGRIWVDRIAFTDSKTTSYGTAEEVIDSGFVTSKPVEYTRQASAIDPNLRPMINERYSDITPFLARLTPIEQYKEYRQRQDIQKFAGHEAVAGEAVSVPVLLPGAEVNVLRSSKTPEDEPTIEGGWAVVSRERAGNPEDDIITVVSPDGSLIKRYKKSELERIQQF